MQNSFIITIPSSEYLTFNFILTKQLSDDGLPRYLTVKAVGFFYSLEIFTCKAFYFHAPIHTKRDMIV